MSMETQLARTAPRLRLALTVVLCAVMVTAFGIMPAQATWQSIRRAEIVSVSKLGAAGNSYSFDPAINDDGRYVAFCTEASNLAPDDPNGDRRDVVRVDRMTGEVELVSAPRSGGEADRGSRSPAISDDGRYVVFLSGKDHVAADTNNDQDLYVRDMVTGAFTWIDFLGDGSSIGDDVWDIQISGNGRVVIFETDDDLLPGDSGPRDVYAYDLESEEATVVSGWVPGMDQPSRGSRDGVITDNGRYVLFFTRKDLDPDNDDNDYQDYYIKDLATGEYRWIDFAGTGEAVYDDAWDTVISGDGTWFAFDTDETLLPEDTEADRDVYAYDLVNDVGVLVSVPRAGGDETTRGSRSPSISDDGRYISVFSGQDFVAEDTNSEQDLYVKDMDTDEWARLPVTGNDSSPGSDLGPFVMSGDGTMIAFEDDEDFLPDDRNGYEDILVTDTREFEMAMGSTRLAGPSRYTTAVDTSREMFPKGADTVVIATGENWPDALGGSALAGAVDGPILLTKKDMLPDAVKAELTRLGARNAYVLGGYNAVSPAVETQLDLMLSGYVWRIGGPDRYATSKAVANRAIEVLGVDYDGSACVATGMNFPDAVAAAPLGAGLGWPVLLVRPTDPVVLLPADTTDALILGGTSAVPGAVETYLKKELGSANVVRQGGANRYATAALVAQYGVDSGLTWNGVGISTGEGFPDALTGGAALGLRRAPLLLTPADSLHPATKYKLTAEKADIDTVNFLGGSAAVSSSVETQVKSLLGL